VNYITFNRLRHFVKLSNPHEDRYFTTSHSNYFWRQSHWRDIRLHGELYTSSAFSEAHCEVQEMPGEPVAIFLELCGINLLVGRNTLDIILATQIYD